MTGISLFVVSVAFGIACIMTYWLTVAGGRLRILDHPNQRSLHTRPTPRTGGLAIWVGTLVPLVLWLGSLGFREEVALMIGSTVLVGAVSFIDDRSHVPEAIRLSAQVVAAGLFVAGGFTLQSIRLPGIDIAVSAPLGLLFSVAFIVWMTNLYNFMDGMDGFAAGMAVSGFGTLGLLGFLAGDDHFATLCWVIVAAAGGFLAWNFPPARIFMGDTGASVLGLMAAALSLLADKVGLFPLWISMLVFSPFVVDATVTLLRRIVRGERVWEAHRNHYYQRLVRLGWGHKKTVLVEYLLMGGCGITAIVLLKASPTVQWLGLCVWGLVYAIGICAVARLEASAR